MSYPTFDPIGAGWRLQRGFKIVPEYLVVEDERELGNVSSTAISERPLRHLEGLRFRTDSRTARDYMEAFFRRRVGPAARFYFAWPEYVAASAEAPTITAVSGGSQAQRSITVRIAWKNDNGTTLASPTATLTVPANELVKVWVEPYPPNITQCVIYAAEDDPGGEEQQTILTSLRTWTQPDAALLTGTASPPTSNTAKETPLCKIAAGSFDLVRGEGLTWEASMVIEEVYP